MVQPLVLSLTLLAFLVKIDRIDALFINSNWSDQSVRNISCVYYSSSSSQSSIITGNGLTNASHSPYYDFCAIRQVNSTLSNGTTIFRVFMTPMTGYNEFKQFISDRCLPGQFQPAITPIGYGSCARLPYESYTVKICICSTDNCNLRYSLCEASVQAAQSSPPRNLPPYFHERTSRISCREGYRGLNYAGMFNESVWSDNEFYPMNLSGIRQYKSNHAVACLMEVDGSGDYYQISLTSEEYSERLNRILFSKRFNSWHIYAETRTSVASAIGYANQTNASLYSNDTVNFIRQCICTTNYCNQDLTTCVNGLSGSGSTTPAASTTAGSNSTDQNTAGTSSNSSSISQTTAAPAQPSTSQ